MSEPAVVVKDLVKIFPAPDRGQVRAVDGVSFNVERGEVFGFLGPNGAGKTTTLEIIEGLQPATSGTVEIFGFDVAAQPGKVKPFLGVQLQTQSYFDKIHLDELLELFGSFYGVAADAAGLLELVELTEKRRSTTKELSGGQAQRFAIALSLVNDPKVVFLDEPTSGLDPQARHRLWEIVRSIRESGRTVVMTTHYMDEAEILCDRVAIIDHGTIRALDTPLRLIQSLDTAYHIKFTTEKECDEAKLLKLPGAAHLTHGPVDEGLRYDLAVGDPSVAVDKFMKLMSRSKITPKDLRVEPSTLEDVFLSLTGRELRD